MWVSSGLVNNPVAGQVLLDTGPQGGGNIGFTVYAAANADAAFDIQTFGEEVTRSQAITVSAWDTRSISANLNQASLNEGERMRIVQINNVIGVVSVSLFYIR